MAGGRPTSYNSEMIQITKDFLVLFSPTMELDEAGDETGNELPPERKGIPTIARLSVLLQVSRSTLYNWIEAGDSEGEMAEFLDILRDLMAIQEDMLMNGGLLGTYNSVMAKLGLTKHNYSDKQDTQHSGAIDLTGKTEKELDDIIGGK